MFLAILDALVGALPQVVISNLFAYAHAKQRNQNLVFVDDTDIHGHLHLVGWIQLEGTWPWHIIHYLNDS